MTRTSLANECVPHLGLPRWRVSPTLPLFCKAMQIPCNTLETLGDTIVHIEYFRPFRPLAHLIFILLPWFCFDLIVTTFDGPLHEALLIGKLRIRGMLEKIDKVINVWYTQHYLIRLHSLSPAVLTLLNFQLSQISLIKTPISFLWLFWMYVILVLVQNTILIKKSVKKELKKKYLKNAYWISVYYKYLRNTKCYNLICTNQLYINNWKFRKFQCPQMRILGYI